MDVIAEKILIDCFQTIERVIAYFRPKMAESHHLDAHWHQVDAVTFVLTMEDLSNAENDGDITHTSETFLFFSRCVIVLGKRQQCYRRPIFTFNLEAY